MLPEITLAALFLLVSFQLIVARRLRTAVGAYQLQSWLLGGIAIALFVHTHLTELLLFGLLIVSLKGVAIPTLLRRRMRVALSAGRESSYHVGFPTALLLGAALSLAGFIAASRIPSPSHLLPGADLGIGIAVLLLGLFTTTARRDGVLQMGGLLAAENGLLLIGLVLAPRLSLLIEFALVLDVLIAVVVMSFLLARMREEVFSTDTSELTRLRG